MKIFINGLLTGLILQIALGPVFFFIVNIVLQKTLYDGLAAAIAVTIVDYLYITLAILGVGKLLEKKKIKKTFGIISSIILIIFGIIIINNIPTESLIIGFDSNSKDILKSFTSVFLLTIFSPMTIVFFTGIFSSKAIEHNYTKHELLIFGLSVGLATLIFMTSSVILLSLLQKTVPIILIQILNLIVGFLLILYGAIRFKRVLKNSA